jgi:trans-aconitate 2-methyltransferase
VTSFDGWDPDQYNRYAAQREQPFWDLAEMIRDVAQPTVVDLGCGDGRLTSALNEKLSATSTLGIDSSPSMIGAAGKFANEHVTFALGDLETWQEERAFDVVFANASLQWVPNHAEVLARWAKSLKPHGQLAVQVPANADHPSHVVAAEVAAQFLKDPPPDAVARNVLAPEVYAKILDQLGFEQQHVRLQVYAHRLQSTNDVVEWVKGTSLTRFKEPLGDEDWLNFVEVYRERLLSKLGIESPHFYPFKRILMWARRD